MISKALKAWCEESGTGALYIDPGSPWQNGIVESFNGRLRDELLSSEIFDTLARGGIQDLQARWMRKGNFAEDDVTELAATASVAERLQRSAST
ncbi:MAG: transposase [Gammaproteobacteria bacterium]|nr:transposase [Gammaproteobacteria bacterium]